MQIVSTTGATTVTDPEHGSAKADKHGVFDLPHEFAAKLLSHAGWLTAAEAEGRKVAAELERLRDPAELAKAVVELRHAVTDLAGRVRTKA